MSQAYLEMSAPVAPPPNSGACTSRLPLLKKTKTTEDEVLLIGWSAITSLVNLLSDWLEKSSCLGAPENKLERVLVKSPWESSTLCLLSG